MSGGSSVGNNVLSMDSATHKLLVHDDSVSHKSDCIHDMGFATMVEKRETRKN